MTQKDKLLKILFEDRVHRFVDIKFCRGSAETIPEEKFCASVASSIFSLENGLLEGPVSLEEGFREVEIRALRFPA